MHKRKSALGAILAAAIAIAAPGVASAGFILDTGTPSSASLPAEVVNSSQSFAAEFSLTAGESISELSAYITAGADQPGATFTFNIYSSGLVGARTPSSLLLSTTSATYSADGWNSVAVSWTAPSTGDYWLAITAPSTQSAPGLDAPQEASATTGTVPALAFAYEGSSTSSKFTTTGAPAIGLEITGAVSPTPLPAAAWFFGSGLLGIGAMLRRKRASA